MNLDSFTGPGSTPSRRRFWDKVTQAVLASQKVEGKNVSVDVRDGYGSVINIPSSSPGRGGTPHTGGTPPCCPSATLVCDQICASATQCGYTTSYFPHRWFLNETLIGDRTLTQTFSCSGQPGTATNVSTTTDVATGASRTKDPTTCTEISNITGTNAHNTHLLKCNGSTADFPSSSSYTVSGGLSTLVQCDFCALPHTTTAIVGDTIVTTCDQTSGGCHEVGHTTYAFSSENTVEPTLPDYSDCFGCSFESCTYPEGEDCICVASQSYDDTNWGICRFKYKFVFDAPLEAECKICWIVRTTLAGGDPTDELICETIAAGETESSVHECLEPDTNGTRTVVYPIGQCCASNGDCSVTDETDCVSGGGEYQGDSCSDDPCADVTCTPKTGACCNYDDNTCTITTEADCTCPACSWAGPDTICPDDCFF